MSLQTQVTTKTSADDRTAPEAARAQGADLLLSLAATASEHGKRALQKKLLTPSPGSSKTREELLKLALPKSGSRHASAGKGKMETAKASEAESPKKKRAMEDKETANKKSRRKTDAEADDATSEGSSSSQNRIISPASSNASNEVVKAEEEAGHPQVADGAGGHFYPRVMPPWAGYASHPGYYGPMYHPPPPPPRFPHYGMPYGPIPPPIQLPMAHFPMYHPAYNMGYSPPPRPIPSKPVPPPIAVRKTPPRPSQSKPKPAPKSQQEDVEWQNHDVVSSSANANRCEPRKHLYPPDNWSERIAEADSIEVPEFHKLVNFPDFMTRAGRGAAERDGCKGCVMCGKLRICSATNARSKADKTDDETKHIIPRQNKGVCTACDVAVWVFQGWLDIKWCKGCKNFRPWPAFGEKVMATKCVRCRERQKEKYAATKGQGFDTVNHDDEVRAADGLRTLLLSVELSKLETRSDVDGDSV